MKDKVSVNLFWGILWFWGFLFTIGYCDLAVIHDGFFWDTFNSVLIVWIMWPHILGSALGG